MATNQAGTLLYVANFNNTVGVFSIASNGALTPIPGSPFPTGVSGRLQSLAAFPAADCCTITCPPNITVAASQCPVTNGEVVTFTSPTSSGDCGAVTCSPPSGSIFPIGTTTVACATTAGPSCSFSVTVQGLCLQDDSNPFNSVILNPATGQYSFCCAGMVFTGVGKVTVKGCIVILEHNPTDGRVLIRTDLSVRRGTASLQSPPGRTKCIVTDRDISNNSCECP
jgi:hypothetical protein